MLYVDTCNGICHQSGIAEFGAAYYWLIWEELVNSEVRAALINCLPTMPSLNAQVRALAERLGIHHPDLRTMQNQARLRGKWLFDILREIPVS